MKYLVKLEWHEDQALDLEKALNQVIEVTPEVKFLSNFKEEVCLLNGYLYCHVLEAGSKEQALLTVMCEATRMRAKEIDARKYYQKVVKCFQTPESLIDEIKFLYSEIRLDYNVLARAFGIRPILDFIFRDEDEDWEGPDPHHVMRDLSFSDLDYADKRSFPLAVYINIYNGPVNEVLYSHD